MLFDCVRNWRLRRTLDERRVAAYAPYEVSLYRSIVQQAKRQSLPIERFDAPKPVAKRSRIFFRHDIDYSECVRGAPAMLDVNLGENTPVAAFLRVDGEAYPPQDAKDLVKAYRHRGVLFGLHTSCYVHEDYLEALNRERSVFLDTFGFDPTIFTVHGLGHLQLARRLEFTAYATTHLGALGFGYSDCSADLRPYHHVFQDCDRDPVTGCRAMYRDMVKIPPLLRYGRNYLVLTHPCYWKS